MQHDLSDVTIAESRKDGHSVAVADLPTSSVIYLLGYGFGKSLQDSVASTRSDIIALARACNAGGDGFDKAYAKWLKWTKDYGAGAVDYSNSVAVESFVAVAIESDRSTRFQAICDGTVGGRATGPRLDPVERAMRDIAEEIVAASAKENKVAMPKGDDLAAFVAAILESDPDGYRTQAEARVAQAATRVAGLDIGAMLKARAKAAA